MVNSLRKCNVCGLEASTLEELDLFVKGSGREKHGRRNLCKKCSSERNKKDPRRKESHKKWREKNLDKERERVNTWGKENREHLRSYENRRYKEIEEYRENKKRKVAYHSRRYKDCGLTEEILWKHLNFSFFEIYGRFPEKKENVHIDHIIPRIEGGTNNYLNLQLLKAEDNLKKGRSLDWSVYG